MDVKQGVKTTKVLLNSFELDAKMHFVVLKYSHQILLALVYCTTLSPLTTPVNDFTYTNIKTRKLESSSPGKILLDSVAFMSGRIVNVSV